jgi:MerR family transcriptional regulator, redox-sensitive transcriptional activator SoxR
MLCGMPPPARLTIGELAARSGLATSALRYYEEIGLIRSERTAGGQRRYHRAVLRRVAFIRAAQRVGLSLEEAGAALAELPADRPPNAAEWARVARAWQRRIDDQIAELQRLRGRLTGCIGCGCLSLTKCRLYNPDDTAGGAGPGAHYLLTDPPPRPPPREHPSPRMRYRSLARPAGSPGCNLHRDVAQLGSALDWGSRGRRFKSCRPDGARSPLNWHKARSEGFFRA